MKWLLRIVGALALLALVVAIVGWLLPVKHEASRSAEFARTPDEVYALVSDYKNYAAWWPDISKVEVLAEGPGKVTFREHMSDGPIVMSVVEQSPRPGALRVRLHQHDGEFFEVGPDALGGRLEDSGLRPSWGHGSRSLRSLLRLTSFVGKTHSTRGRKPESHEVRRTESHERSEPTRPRSSRVLLERIQPARDLFP
jgi:polyketide cyclase/dehydrase/lipid transport protein